MKDKSYMCTNCLWTGPSRKMVLSGDELSCPRCCAVFNSEDPEEGPWKPLHDEETDEEFLNLNWDED